MPLAIITGATKGIGKAIAKVFIQNGFDLAICSRTYADLEALKTKWNIDFPKQQIFIQQVDVKEKFQLQDFVNNIKSTFTELNVLVNNAGLFIPGNILDEDDSGLEEMIAVNLYSIYYLSRMVAPIMMQNKKGHIFNVSSIAATRAYPNGGSYSISKYAVKGFSDNLRYELTNHNVKVTTLTPGAVWTDSWIGSGVEEERIMKSSDIAAMVWTAYQLSPSAVVENIVFRPQLGDL